MRFAPGIGRNVKRTSMSCFTACDDSVTYSLHAFFTLYLAHHAGGWEVGKALLFDDAFVHSVWNETSEERVVLLADIWHPDLTAGEIGSIQQMFREVESMQQARRNQS